MLSRIAGFLFADAVRWRYLDPETAGANYYDPLAPWESSGGIETLRDR